MIGKNKLNDRDRNFFRAVAKSAFSNPFGAESLQLLDIIAGGRHEDNDIRTQKVSARMRKKLEIITGKGKFTWRSFDSEDQDLVRVSLLYDTYYRCYKEFDVLIIKQTEAGHTPCPVPFAKGTLSLLRKRGFNADEALRYFGF